MRKRRTELFSFQTSEYLEKRLTIRTKAGQQSNYSCATIHCTLCSSCTDVKIHEVMPQEVVYVTISVVHSCLNSDEMSYICLVLRFIVHYVLAWNNINK
jgi:hypothetical protein